MYLNVTNILNAFAINAQKNESLSMVFSVFFFFWLDICIVCIALLDCWRWVHFKVTWFYWRGQSYGLFVVKYSFQTMSSPSSVLVYFWHPSSCLAVVRDVRNLSLLLHPGTVFFLPGAIWLTTCLVCGIQRVHFNILPIFNFPWSCRSPCLKQFHLNS